MRAYLLLLTLTSVLSAFSQETAFTLKGKIAGQDEGMIYLHWMGSTGVHQDSASISKGSFEFKGNINEPLEARLTTSKNLRSMYDPKVATIYLEPTVMTVELTAGDFKQMKVSGSQTQDDYTGLDKQVQLIRQESKLLSDQYDKANMAYIVAKKANKPDAELEDLKNKADVLHQQLAPYSERTRKVMMAFIDTHPNSYYAASILRYFISSMKPEQAKTYYNKFPLKIQQSGYGKALQNEIAFLQAGSAGTKAFVFSKNDINGQLFDLAEYQGKKYVLIDFWASWCVPCRAGNPHLLSLYSKYKDKGLEIVGVSDDDSSIPEWKKAVDHDKIGVWRHVLRGLKKTSTGYDKTDDVSEHYGIHSLPTKILIDKNGVIVGRFGGGGDTDEDMDKMLASIFK